MSAVAGGLPEGVTARTVEVPGGPLALLETAGDGGTVLMVPGFTGSKEDFTPVLPLLADRGFRVLAVDQRGQHESPGPDDPSAYTTEALGRELLDLLDALGTGPVHLVGHSFGGLVSRAALLADPGRFRSFALMDSGPSALTGPRADALPFLRPILVEGGLQAVWEASRSMPVDPTKPPVSEDVRDFLEARFFGSSAAGLLGMSDALLSEPDRVEELRATGVPVLVLYGEGDDAWSPQVQDEMAERLGAPVVVVPQAWHSPAVENPALTAQVLGDWLSRQ